MGIEYDRGRSGQSPPNMPGPGWNSSEYSRGLLQKQLRDIRETGPISVGGNNVQGGGQPAPPGTFGLAALLWAAYLYLWPSFERSGVSNGLRDYYANHGFRDNAFLVLLTQIFITIFVCYVPAIRFPKLSFVVGAGLVALYYFK